MAARLAAVEERSGLENSFDFVALVLAMDLVCVLMCKVNVLKVIIEEYGEEEKQPIMRQRSAYQSSSYIHSANGHRGARYKHVCINMDCTQTGMCQDVGNEGIGHTIFFFLSRSLRHPPSPFYFFSTAGSAMSTTTVSRGALPMCASKKARTSARTSSQPTSLRISCLFPLYRI